MNKTQILNFYKRMLRKAKEIEHYNFREHAVRRLRYEFRTNDKLDEKLLTQKYDQLNRIAVVQNLYYKPVLI
jgi:hypothetical protein